MVLYKYKQEYKYIPGSSNCHALYTKSLAYN